MTEHEKVEEWLKARYAKSVIDIPEPYLKQMVYACKKILKLEHRQAGSQPNGKIVLEDIADVRDGLTHIKDILPEVCDCADLSVINAVKGGIFRLKDGYDEVNDKHYAKYDKDLAILCEAALNDVMNHFKDRHPVFRHLLEATSKNQEYSSREILREAYVSEQQEQKHPHTFAR